MEGIGDRHLPIRQVVVCVEHLGQSAIPVGIGRRLLSEYELRRAGRYKFRADSERYVRRHAFVRLMLASVLDEQPDRLLLDETRWGKPTVQGLPLHFSMSHTGNFVALAYSLDRRVGVDIESVRLLDIDESLFVDEVEGREMAMLARRVNSNIQRAILVLQAWTRKEAVLKAIEVGLVVSPTNVHVGCQRGRRMAIVSADVPDTPRGVAMAVENVDTDEPVVCAVAAEGDDWHTVVSPNRRFDLSRFEPSS
jgi:phosphopantetheinyl transferase